MILVRKYHVGYTVDYSIKAFEELLDTIDKASLSKFKNNNQKLYETKFSWEKSKKRYWHLIIIFLIDVFVIVVSFD
jgi:hypothetical protein